MAVKVGPVQRVEEKAKDRCRDAKLRSEQRAQRTLWYNYS
jgi:hypothetical protein